MKAKNDRRHHTTSGTGSEVTPFAVVTDDATGQKYPLADYALTSRIWRLSTPTLVMRICRSPCVRSRSGCVTHARSFTFPYWLRSSWTHQALQVPGTAEKKTRRRLTSTGCANVFVAQRLSPVSRLPTPSGVCHPWRTNWPSVPHSARRSGERPADL